MSEIVAERVRKAREHRGWSQKELAKRATVHHVVLNRLEKGHKSGVQAETIRRLAEALHVTSDYLLGLSDKLESEGRPANAA
jgi:transcriptional regulator with XRE-family HTH domain